jgi:hypothetical protein
LFEQVVAAVKAHMTVLVNHWSLCQL